MKDNSTPKILNGRNGIGEISGNRRGLINVPHMGHEQTSRPHVLEHNTENHKAHDEQDDDGNYLSERVQSRLVGIGSRGSAHMRRSSLSRQSFGKRWEG